MDGKFKRISNNQEDSSSTGTKEFPAGLRILVVDDDSTCLFIVQTLLKSYQYEVVGVRRGIDALSILRERPGCFDLVITDVHMPGMDGFELLEHIKEEFNLPVIMMSGDDKVNVVTRGLEKGACFYLFKPVTMSDAQTLWQHVVKTKRDAAIMMNMEQTGSVGEVPPPNRRFMEEIDSGSSSVNEANSRVQDSLKRKDLYQENDDDHREAGRRREPRYRTISTHKKPRVVWNAELHNQFLDAIETLGVDKAVPKKILEIMKVPGLTRENVASHLQKYRLFVKKLVEANQNIEPSTVKSLASGAFATSFADYPASVTNLQQAFPQFSEATQRSLAPGFGGTFQGGYNNTSPFQFGQSVPMNNQGLMGRQQRPWKSAVNNMPSLNQRNVNPSYGYSSGQGIRLSSTSPRSNVSAGGVNINPRSGRGTMKMVHEQKLMGRAKNFGTGPIDRNLFMNTLSLQSSLNKINNPMVGNMGSFGNFSQAPNFNPINNNNFTGIQIINNSPDAAGTLHIGPIAPLESSNNSNNMDLSFIINKPPPPAAAGTEALSNPNISEFPMFSAGFTTPSNEASSFGGGLSSANQFSSMFNNVALQQPYSPPPPSPPPPPAPALPAEVQQQQLGGDPFEGLFDLVRSTSNLGLNSLPQLFDDDDDDFGDFLFKSFEPTADQRKYGEQLLDPSFDVSAYQVDGDDFGL